MQYLFHPKHHHSKSTKWSQWRPDLPDEDEFQVFELADLHALERGPNGDMFGVLPAPGGDLRFIGTDEEQVAFFPEASVGLPWHGYPVIPAR